MKYLKGMKLPAVGCAIILCIAVVTILLTVIIPITMYW